MPKRAAESDLEELTPAKRPRRTTRSPACSETDDQIICISDDSGFQNDDEVIDISDDSESGTSGQSGSGAKTSNNRKNKNKPGRGAKEPEGDNVEDMQDTDEEFERLNTAQIKAAIEEDQTRSRGVAQMGIIVKLEMHNFMCHKYLTFNFGPQINFIIGNNGSGKSAALSAITIALGGKATSTGRGQGMKAFIKSGESQAQISITLKNGGPEPFKHEEYGDSITIVRTFKADGGGTWKIKNTETGKTISTMRDELSNITDYFGIDVDNPINILSQDSARQFLSATNPIEKYRLFLKGTRLKQLQEEYDIIQDNLTKTNSVQEKKKVVVDDLTDNLRQLLRKYKDAGKFRQEQDRVDDLRKELAWAFIGEKEDELTKAMTAVAEAEEKIALLQAKFEEASAKVTEAERVMQAIEAENNELRGVDEIQAENVALTEQIKTTRDDLKNVKNDIRELQANLKQKISEIKGFETTIVEQQAKADNDDRLRELNSQLDAAVQDKEKKVQLHKKLLRELAESRAAVDKAEQDLRDHGQNVVPRLRENARGAEGRVNNLKEIAAKGGIAIYGREMPNLLKAISQAQWVGPKPVGPLGLHVTLKDQRFASVMRTGLGKHLSSFAVTNEKDRAQLLQLLSKHRMNNQVIVSRVDLFDYSRGEPPEKFPTVLRVLEISDPWVTRLLINIASMERILLAKDRLHAESILKEISGFTVWTADGYTVRRYADGGGQTSPFGQLRRDNWAHQLFAHQDVTASLREAEQDLARVAEEFNQGKAQHDQLQRGRNIAKDAAQRLKDAEQRALRDAQAAESRRVQLANAVGDAAPLELAAIHSAKEAAEQEHSNIQDQLVAAEARRLQLSENVNPLAHRQNDVRRLLQRYNEERQEIKNRAEEQTECLIQLRQDVGHYERKLATARNEIERRNEAAKVIETEFKDWVKKASVHSERVKTDRKPEAVKRELEALKRELQERVAEQGQSIEELKLEVEKAKAAKEKAENDFKQLNKLNKLLRWSLTFRRHRWEEFRRHIALRSRLQFAFHLSMRGFFGHAMFHHRQEHLTLKVQTELSSQAKEKDPNSMSGGEKSFATICLLISLWDAIGSPIRALDEFDVYMDAINRRISIKMILEAAKISGRQFILITPQDMAGLRLGPEVRVHRMKDPERGQRQLQF